MDHFIAHREKKGANDGTSTSAKHKKGDDTGNGGASAAPFLVALFK